MQEILDYIDPTVCAQLRRAIEIGRWPDGSDLSDEQRALCLQAVILYEARELPPEQRVGFIEPGSKPRSCGADAVDDGKIIVRQGAANGE